MEKYVQIERVGQTFDTKKGKFVALRDIDLTIRQGEFIALIGHSGCGKSTLLNLIAGLTLPTNGVLLLEDREINGPGPERAVVFQNHSLLPWLTCFENVYLAVERVFGEKEGKQKLKDRTAAAINLVGLDHASGKYPNEISGGMKQRVGMLLSDRIVMMTNGPAATIGEVLDVKLPRPRHRLTLAHDPDYIGYRAAVLEFLYEKQAHVEKIAA